MGYACIYESMLDSVLVARDKFLRKEEHELGQGLMAPSQCRMLLGLTDASELVRERIRFWDDVHGTSTTRKLHPHTEIYRRFQDDCDG